MPGTPSGSNTLDLLAQYNNHISERDKQIDYIEKKLDLEDNRPSYDELFKENVKLRLQLAEYEAEIKGLKEVIEELRRERTSIGVLPTETHSHSVKTDSTQRKVESEKAEAPVVPARSAERKQRSIALARAPQGATKEVGPIEDTKHFRSSNPFMTSKIESLNAEAGRDTDDASDYSDYNGSIETAQVLNIKDNYSPSVLSASSGNNNNNNAGGNENNSTNVVYRHGSVSYSSRRVSVSYTPVKRLDTVASPAASVAYTTSRIAIKSPKKPLRSPLQEHLRSPQNPNRMTTVVNNQLRSPMKRDYHSEDASLFDRSSNYSNSTDHDNKFPNALDSVMRSPTPSSLPGGVTGFSPNQIEKLNNFKQTLRNSFPEDADEGDNNNNKDKDNNNGGLFENRTTNSSKSDPLSPVSRGSPPRMPVSPPGVPSIKLASPIIVNRNSPLSSGKRAGNEARSVDRAVSDSVAKISNPRKGSVVTTSSQTEKHTGTRTISDSAAVGIPTSTSTPSSSSSAAALAAAATTTTTATATSATLTTTADANLGRIADVRSGSEALSPRQLPPTNGKWSEDRDNTKENNTHSKAAVHSEHSHSMSLGRSPTSSLKLPTSSRTRPRAGSSSTVRSSKDTPVAITTSDIPLFVQPDEFGAIKMEIASTVFQDQQMNYGELLVLFSVIDRTSNKEMFKFAKSIQKIRELDVYLKSHVSSLSLPSLPDRSLFQNIIPSKVSQRRDILNNYFKSVFSVPVFPSNVSLKIAQFLSTDTVMHPVIMGDGSTEGPLIMRRPKKALSSGNSWKIRYGVLNGDVLQLLEAGEVSEVIRLRQSTIELIPNLPEDKYGTKNGFLITEHKKTGLSTNNKYYLCTETPKERESWISAIATLSENTKSAYPPPSPTPTNHNSSISSSAANTTVASEPMDQIYVTDLTRPDTISSSSQPAPQASASFSSGTPTSHTISSSLGTNTGHTLISSPFDQYDNNTTQSTSFQDDEKENRRTKMRSIFPFKKFTSMTNYTLHSNLSSHSISTEAENGTEVATVSSTNENDTSSDKASGNFMMGSPNINGSASLSQSSGVTVFGSPLDSCLKLSSHVYHGVYEIPSVVYRCLEYLYKNRGIQEEGIFRLSGSSTLIKTLQEEFERSYDVDLCNYKVAEDNSNNPLGVNTISGLLKLYLRRLPHSIIGDEQFSTFKSVTDSHYDKPAVIAKEFRKLIKDGTVPHSNVSLMFALFELLTRINDNCKNNKMNLRNLCIVFSPTLNIPITMLQPFIVDFNCIFKGEEPIDDERRERLDVHIPQV